MYSLEEAVSINKNITKKFLSLQLKIDTSIQERDKIDKGDPSRSLTDIKTQGNRNFLLIKEIKSPEEVPDLPLEDIKNLKNIIETKGQDKDILMALGIKTKENEVLTIMNPEEETTMKRTTKRMKKDINKNTLLKEGQKDLTMMTINSQKEGTMTKSALIKGTETITEEKKNQTMRTPTEEISMRMKVEEKVLIITKKIKTDMLNKVTIKDKDMKKIEAKALEKINIPDLIETEMIKEDYMMIDTEILIVGKETIIKEEDKEIEETKEAEVEKKAHKSKNITEETDTNKIHQENNHIDIKEIIPEVEEVQEETKIEIEDTQDQRTGKGNIQGLKTEKEGVPDLTHLTEYPIKEDFLKKISLTIPLIESMNIKDTHILM